MNLKKVFFVSIYWRLDCYESLLLGLDKYNNFVNLFKFVNFHVNFDCLSAVLLNIE